MYYSEYEAFLEGYSDALLEMEEDNDYEDAYLEGYYTALDESNNVAGKYYSKKHLPADIASGILPFTNTTQSIRAATTHTKSSSLNQDYNEYLSLCKEYKVKPMSKDKFIKKAKEFYRRRAIGKGVSIAGDAYIPIPGLKVGEAIFNHFYEKNVFKDND